MAIKENNRGVSLSFLGRGLGNEGIRFYVTSESREITNFLLSSRAGGRAEGGEGTAWLRVELLLVLPVHHPICAWAGRRPLPKFRTRPLRSLKVWNLRSRCWMHSEESWNRLEGIHCLEQHPGLHLILPHWGSFHSENRPLLSLSPSENIWCLATCSAVEQCHPKWCTLALNLVRTYDHWTWKTGDRVSWEKDPRRSVCSMTQILTSLGCHWLLAQFWWEVARGRPFFCSLNWKRHSWIWPVPHHCHHWYRPSERVRCCSWKSFSLSVSYFLRGQVLHIESWRCPALIPRAGEKTPYVKKLGLEFKIDLLIGCFLEGSQFCLVQITKYTDYQENLALFQHRKSRLRILWAGLAIGKTV